MRFVFLNASVSAPFIEIKKFVYFRKSHLQTDRNMTIMNDIYLFAQKRRIVDKKTVINKQIKTNLKRVSN